MSNSQSAHTMAKKKIVNSKKAKKAKELTRLGSALRTLGGLGGTAVGSMIGMPTSGGSVGSSLGASLSRWLGSGDYEVSTNSIVQRANASGTIPAMHREGQSIVVRHKEYVAQISGKQAFTVVNTFAINPGLSNLFPWLASIATSFQEYKIRGMVYHYVPSSGNAISGTNAALGTVMMQTTYRSNDTAPASKVEMLNEYWSSESVPSQPFCHPIECNPKENPFNIQYVRTGTVPSGDNQLLYDLGTTYVAVSGQQADNTVLGDLWITYEIELKKPILTSNVTTSQVAFGWWVGGTYTTSNLFNGTLSSAGNLAVTTSVMTMTFPLGTSGKFAILLSVNGSGNLTACDFGIDPTYVNCSSYNNPVTTTTQLRNVLSGGTPQLNTGLRWNMISIPDPSVIATVTFANLAGLTTATASTYVVLKFSS